MPRNEGKCLKESLQELLSMIFSLYTGVAPPIMFLLQTSLSDGITEQGR